MEYDSRSSLAVFDLSNGQMPLVDSTAISLTGDREHRARNIKAKNASRLSRRLVQRLARPEADLEHVVVRFDIEKIKCGAVDLAVISPPD